MLLDVLAWFHLSVDAVAVMSFYIAVCSFFCYFGSSVRCRLGVVGLSISMCSSSASFQEKHVSLNSLIFFLRSAVIVHIMLLVEGVFLH